MSQLNPNHDPDPSMTLTPAMTLTCDPCAPQMLPRLGPGGGLLWMGLGAALGVRYMCVCQCVSLSVCFE